MVLCVSVTLGEVFCQFVFSFASPFCESSDSLFFSNCIERIGFCCCITFSFVILTHSFNSDVFIDVLVSWSNVFFMWSLAVHNFQKCFQVFFIVEHVALCSCVVYSVCVRWDSSFSIV